MATRPGARPTRLSERHAVGHSKTSPRRLRDVTLTMATDDAFWSAEASKMSTYWMPAPRMSIKRRSHVLSEQRATIRPLATM